MVKHKLMVESPSNPNVFILEDNTRNPYKQREKKLKSKIAMLVSVTFVFGLLMGHGSHKIMSDTSTGSSLDKYYGADDDQTPGEFYDHSLEVKGRATCKDAHDSCPHWAAKDECKANPEYMLNNCARSCGVCQDIEETEEKDQPSSSDPTSTEETEEEEQQPLSSDPSSTEEAEEEKKEEEQEKASLSDSTPTEENEVEQQEEKEEKEEEEKEQPLSSDSSSTENDPIPDDCKDAHDSCPHWAAIDECKANPEYMLNNCARSCGVCQDIEETEEKDQPSSSDPTSTEETEEEEQQPLSSDPSSTEEAEEEEKEEEQEKASSSDSTSTEENEEEQQEEEEEKEEQQEEEQPLSSDSSSTENDPIPDDCKDAHDSCPHWAAKDECKANPEYMLNNCARSCGVCQDIEETEEKDQPSSSDSTSTEEEAATPSETSPKDGEAASTPTENIQTLDASVVDLDWFKTRDDHFTSWFEGDESTTDNLLENADQSGPILDFFIIGNNHCTADLTKSLMHVTPMVPADVCTPVHQTVWYSYQNWAKIEGNENKPLRGSHCSSFMGSGNDANAVEFSQHLPKTKLMVGIKHPVIWFKEFWDQAAKNKQLDRMTNNQDPYELTTLCTRRRCRHTCKLNQFFCMHRSRFHLGLARLGKTPLSEEERKYLAVDDEDGGNAVKNDQVKNPVFLYDDLELTGEYFWESLAKYLGVDHIPHDLQQLKESRLDHDKELANVNSLDFCKNEYDDLRARLLSYSYEMATWLQLYWIPLASDESRADVAVADPTVFNGLLEKYKKDPCNKLVRSKMGKYVVP
ncbi:hypothetical protein CTEN210_03757 [Chaetoceros tenuissimus]|uniref:ShKT domain-containing protein n=1 Tax=Chaetoceros tenuissimus TaxID=426638 RepID=A0AAD3H1N4_9STRA|nr:hypothetical protein CTEN210_03757 [Chaetoceros tenuissimus]